MKKPWIKRIVTMSLTGVLLTQTPVGILPVLSEESSEEVLITEYSLLPEEGPKAESIIENVPEGDIPEEPADELLLEENLPEAALIETEEEALPGLREENPEQAVIEAAVYTDAREAERFEAVRIQVEGLFPKGITAKAYPVAAGLGEEVFTAYALMLYDKDGAEYHADGAAGGAGPITVTVWDESLAKALREMEDTRLWSLEGERKQDLPFSLQADGSVRFTAQTY